MKKLKAKKLKKYIIEPVKEGYNSKWEGHHATNPCSVRFKEDPRVFLGYRAGGDEDFFVFDIHDVWSSHLGLAVLDPSGLKIEHRLPLPIMTKVNDFDLPQTREEYDEFMKGPHRDKICVLHDFRFFNYRGYLHVIFHEGTIYECYDCVVRMPVDEFLDKIEKSIQLSSKPTEEIIDQWHKLWWADDVWEPCGVGGTNRIFPSPVTKGDIIYYEKPDGTLQLCHRPLADAMAVFDTGTNLYASATPDGITEYGVFETNIRPTLTDNSHIGNNGLPIRVKIGNVDAYMDITHGCYQRRIHDESMGDDMAVDGIFYYAYLRIKDCLTGDVLYYSNEPILDYDQVWKEYAQEGEWVAVNKMLGGVMFAGGQIETTPGKVGLDDEYVTYVGVGDTAVAMATFTLRDLMPDKVIEDINVRASHQAEKPSEQIDKNTFNFPEKINGWNWSVENDPVKYRINIVRALDNGETHARPVHLTPGSFDADAMIFNGSAVKMIEGIGWAVIYRAARWELRAGIKKSRITCGLLILDPANPEKILYHSEEPLAGIENVVNSWTVGSDLNEQDNLIENVTGLITAQQEQKLRRFRRLFDAGKLFPSQMIKWQRQKSGLDKPGEKSPLP
jgi:hypothetical protein